MAEPRFITQVDASLPNDGGQILDEVRRLGLEPMPWQEQAAFILGALLPDGVTRRYPVVISTTPRQCGKTTMFHGLIPQRSKLGEGRRSYGTSLTKTDFATLLEELSLENEETTHRKYRGDERVTWPNGSYVGALSKKGWHGKTTTGVGILDEVWDLDAATMNGAEPTLLAAPMGQLLITSTMGTYESEAWNAKVELGRESIEDPNSLIGYIEYAAPTDEAVWDRSTYEDWHPSYGYTQHDRSLDLFIASLSLDASGVVRAIGNRLTATTSALFPDEWLHKAFHPAVPTPDKFVVGVDVSHDPVGSAISFGFLDREGHLYGGKYEAHYGGGDWIPNYLERMIRDRKVQAVTADFGRPSTQTLKAALQLLCERHGVPLVERTSRQVGADNFNFFEALKEGKITVRQTEDMENALKGAQKRDSGEYWYISDRRSAHDVAPLISMILAVGVAKELSLRPPRLPTIVS